MIPDSIDIYIFGFLGIALLFPLIILLKLFHNWFIRINEIIDILKSIEKKVNK